MNISPRIDSEIRHVPIGRRTAEIYRNLPDVTKVLDSSECSPESLLGAILQGTHHLWVYPNGWIVTASFGPWLDIVAWRNLSNRKEAQEVLVFFERLARVEQRRGIRMVTPRSSKLAERWFRGTGFKQRLVEYVKEF